MNNKRMKQVLKEEKGAASIVEYSMVLPFCLFTIVFLFMCGYVLNQRAVLDSATERSLLIAQKIYTDPNYLNIVALEGNMVSTSERDYVGYKNKVSDQISNLESDPYRYWSNNYKSDLIRNLVEVKARNIILKNQLLPLSPIGKSMPDIVVSDMKGIIFKEMNITITQTIRVPILRAFNIEPILTMKSAASINITSPTELIRNSHFAWDVLTLVTKGESANIVNKIYTVFDKISNFFHESEGK